MVPFARPDITSEEIKAVTEAMESGWLTSGPKVQAFEREFAEFVGASEAVAVNSATSAALLIFTAIGEVTTNQKVALFPVCTFMGPVNMARLLGFEVRLVDTEPGGLNMSLPALEEAMTNDVAIVCPTHMAGAPCDLDGIREICEPYLACVVDDAAHAFGSLYKNRAVGGDGLSDATFFSFYATKAITTGDGGMVTTRNSALAERIRRLRTHGFSRDAYNRYTDVGASWRYDVAYLGHKANLTDFSAALGSVQLQRSENMRLARTVIAHRYASELKGVPGINPIAVRGLPGDRHAHHLYQVLVPGDRDGFIRRMHREGVQCSVHFIPVHHHSVMRFYGDRRPMPEYETVFDRSVSLPLYSSMTDDECTSVIEAVKVVAREMYGC